MFFAVSEILNPLPCCLGEQKFWILRCVLWGFKSSESSPVLFGGSETLKPSLCSLGIRNLSPFLCGLGNPKLWIVFRFPRRNLPRQEIPKSFGFFAWLKDYTAIHVKNGTLLGRIFWFLANRETFYVSFNTSLRFRGYCKSHLWHKVAIMHFYLSSTFYFRPILHSFPHNGTSKPAT